MEALDPIMDAIRPHLQPITQNLPEPIRDLGITLLGDTCYTTLLHDISLNSESSPECLKLALSKGLGIGIVAASSIVKLPQILKLLSSKSASGVSLLGYLLETTSFLIALAYNYRRGFAFSTYGETAMILVQNVVITMLILNYGGMKGGIGALVAVLAVAGYSLFSGDVVGMDGMVYLQGVAGILGVASKVPQIVTIWKEGGTGQLSAFAVVNYLLGSLTRIFTTLQEVDDKLILYNFMAGFSLNAVLMAQMVYYWNTPSKKVQGKKPMPIVEPEGFSTSTKGGEGPVKRTGPTTRRRG